MSTVQPPPTRRSALQGTVAAFLAGCRADEPVDTGGGATSGMVFEGTVPFIEEEPRALDVLTGEGLDGRLITNLSGIDADGLVQTNALFYVRTAQSALIDTTTWSVALRGNVAEEVVLDIDDVRALAVPQGVVQFECSGNSGFGGFGLMSAAEWDGAPLEDVLALVTPVGDASRVRITGFDTYPDGSETSEAGASWVFARDDLAEAFLAVGMNGEDLPPDHGYPVRLVVPGWYGCCNVKWVQEIALVSDDEPSTGHMIEFASRTHQVGEPAFARDFVPAVNDVAAVALRVELWRTAAGGAVYRVIGVTWGGPVPASTLRFHANGVSVQEVAVLPERPDGRTWSVWEAVWEPGAVGVYALTLTVDDPSIRTRRLDTGYYARVVSIAEASS